jgi:hypothetical protein
MSVEAHCVQVPLIGCGGFAGGLKSRCGGVAGAATTESPQTRAKRPTPTPALFGPFRTRSRDFAPLRRQLAISGRTVRVGFPMRFSGVLRSICGLHAGLMPGFAGTSPGVCHPTRAYAVRSEAIHSELEVVEERIRLCLSVPRRALPSREPARTGVPVPRRTSATCAPSIAATRRVWWMSASRESTKPYHEIEGEQRRPSVELCPARR